MGAECDYESANEAFYLGDSYQQAQAPGDGLDVRSQRICCRPVHSQHAGFRAAKDAIAVALRRGIPSGGGTVQELDE